MKPSLVCVAGLVLAGCTVEGWGQTPPGKPLSPTAQKQAERQAEKRTERLADRERLAELDEAWRVGDFAKVDTILDAAWKVDRDWALRSCTNLVLGDDVAMRPLGISQLVAHVTPAELVACLDALDPARMRAERRTLAMLGSKVLAAAAEDDFSRILPAVLKDQDRMMRAAGATAIAVRGNASKLAMLLPLIRESPMQKPSWDGDEEDILQSRIYGAFEAITGVRPKNASEAAAIEVGARARTDGEEAAGTAAAEILTQKIRGRTYFGIRRFELCFEFGKGRAGDAAMARAVEAFAAPASDLIAEAGEPIFGPLTIASPRLIIADRSRYSAVGGNSFRPGAATGNEIALLESLPEAMAATVAHECVHVYHGASFERQPRWLSEGLAESLSLSLEGSIWNDGEVRRRGLDDDLDKGVYSALMSWKGPASSGDRESRLYAMGHLAVDYLRFGPHAAPDARLHLLMARLANHESDRSALEKVYGSSLRDLDRKLAAWARGTP